MQKNILCVAVLLIFIGCEENRQAKSLNDIASIKTEINKKRELSIDKTQAAPSKYKKIKERVPEGECDRYFLAFKDSTVSLCCLEELYNPFGLLIESDISGYLSDYEISYETGGESKTIVFSKNQNMVRLVKWKSEYSDHFELFLGKGQLTDNDLTLLNEIKIGMTKTEFINRYFQFADSTIKKINQVSVCLDERGDSYTKYKFENDTLSRINFGVWEE
ncbi:hypothetical protein [Persicobacter diffluens]|uniref:Lipoprotein n=1 Tax=Persicobacter diffluens TaxID=981 RepID=A0AAN4W253_9BACT|nr:hypothetical protein PEDI_34640 [Persicobacter diffluens]